MVLNWVIWVRVCVGGFVGLSRVGCGGSAECGRGGWVIYVPLGRGGLVGSSRCAWRGRCLGGEWVRTGVREGVEGGQRRDGWGA